MLPATPSSAQPTSPSPDESREDGDTADEGRKGTACPVVGGKLRGWKISFGAVSNVDAATDVNHATTDRSGHRQGRGGRNAPSTGSSSSSKSGPSRKSRSSRSSSNDGIPAGDPAAELTKGEAHRLHCWTPSAIFPSRTRSGKKSRTEDPASGSSHAILVQMVRRGRKRR